MQAMPNGAPDGSRAVFRGTAVPVKLKLESQQNRTGERKIMTKTIVTTFIALMATCTLANTPDIVTENTSNPKLYSEGATSWTINGIKLSKRRSIDASKYGLVPNSGKDQTEVLVQIFKKAAASRRIDTVYVPKGVYIADHVSPAPGINLIGDGPGKTVFDRKDKSNYLLRTLKRDYKGLVIANVTLKNKERIAMMRGSRNIRFFNNELHGGNMRLEECSHIDFEHNVFNENIGKGGYASSNCDRIRMVKNRFNGIEKGSINFSGHTNSYAGYNYITAKKLIDSGYAGIRLPNRAKKNLVEFNYIENHGRGLFVLSGSDDNILRNNVVNKTKHQGALIQAPRTVLENNIFVDAGEGAIVLNNQDARDKHPKTQNCRIANNIIYDTQKLDGDLGLDIRSKNNVIEGNKVLTGFGRKLKHVAPGNKDSGNVEITEIPEMRSVLEVEAPSTKKTRGRE
jgi:hypothetical protein